MLVLCLSGLQIILNTSESCCFFCMTDLVFFFSLFYTVLTFSSNADIPLLPSISSLSAGEDAEPGGLFTVHWLNNKELHFTLAMEVFLQQFRSSLEQQNDCPQEGTKPILRNSI